MSLAAFLAVAGLLTMGAVSPGPAVLMSARTGMSEGLRTGSLLAIGIGAGAVFWALLAFSGLAVIFELAPTLLWAFKIVGGAYLVWLGVQMWRGAATPLPLVTGAPPRTAASAFRLGLVTQLANPKPAVVLSAIFVGTVPPGTPLWVIAVLLGYLFCVETLWNTFVARVFSLASTRRAYTGLKPAMDRTFGTLLGGLGLKIAAT